MRNKYKVGEKVRVRKDLKENTFYNGVGFVREMEQFCGKVVEIDKVYGDGSGAYFIKEDRCRYAWSEEMFEPVITNFDKVKEELEVGEEDKTLCCVVCNAVHRVRNEEDCYGRSCGECIKWLRQPYGEDKKEILNRQERRYLSSVIKPFRNKVKYIKKSLDVGGCFISIELDDDGASLPYFEGDTMYKGMEVEKEYTLEELGL